jgi:hypothetical protein
VLGAQPEDLHAYLSHAGVVLGVHESVHEDQVDEVAVAIVRALWVRVVGTGVKLLRNEVRNRDERQLAGGAQT